MFYGQYKKQFLYSFVYKALGRATEAIICYQHAVQMRPNCAMAFGECYLIKQMLSLAVIKFTLLK